MDQKTNIEQKLKVLQFQNQKLSAQLESQRKEINSLQDRVAQQEAKQDDYAQTILCVNRLWDQLNQDVLSLSTRVTGSDAQLPPTTSDTAAPADSDAITDPYLLQLLKLPPRSPTPNDPSAASAVAEKQANIQAQLTATEKTLTGRAEQTKAALAQLLDAIQRRLEHNDGLQAALQSAPVNDDALRSELQRATGERASLARQLDAASARCRAAEDELRVHADRQVEADEKLKRLQNDLADKEDKLVMLQKKYYALKMAGADQLQPLTPRMMGGPAAAAAAAAAESSKAAAAGAGAGAAGGGAAGEAAGAGVSEALQELQENLQQRNAELQAEREGALQLQRELQDLRAQLASDAWADKSEVYKAAKREAGMLRGLLAEKAAEVESLRGDRDAASEFRSAKSHQALMMAEVKRQLAEREANVRELLAEKEALRARLADLEAAAQLQREDGGSRATVAELRATMEVLQKEAGLARARGDKAKWEEERQERLGQEVAAAAEKLAVAEAEAARLKGAVKDAQDATAASRKREEALQHRMNDLQAFVEVLTVFCDDEKAVAALRASEQALLDRVAQLASQKQAQEVVGKLQEAEEEAGRQRTSAEAAAAEGDLLKGQVAGLQRQVTDLRKEVGTLQEDSNQLMREIEVTAGAYEDIQAQNQRLLQQLQERDETSSQLMSERIKANQHLVALKEEMEVAKHEAERCRREAGDLVALRDKLNQEVTHLAGELSQARETARTVSGKVDELKRALAEAEQAGVELRARLEAAEKLAGEHKRALDEELERCSGERAKRQRVEDDCKSLQARVERLKRIAAPQSEVKELGAEVEGMRKMLNCNVCHERRKDVIITKCWHMFCQHCIRRNLETRHRKCPGCGAAFGQADVKHFYFT